jgi:hypothetical protein
MNKQYCFFAFFLFIFFSNWVFAQNAKPEWLYIIDGYNDTFVSDLEVDKEGNTYLAVNYCGALTLSGLNKKMPPSGHVHGLLIKLNKNGKPLWAHGFKSAYDNRINDLSLAPNGDVLITGFGDGVMHFPGLSDTLKYGRDREKNGYHYPQAVYAARYSTKGERIWVHYWNTGWAEGMSIAANSKDDVYFSYYHTGSLRDNKTLIDSFPVTPKLSAMVSIAHIDKDGKLAKINHFDFQETSSSAHTPRLKFDQNDNLYMYGAFKGKLKFSEKDSLTNDAYYESNDSYIVKYNPAGEILWKKKIGGQNGQWVKEIQFGEDGSVYAAGEYSFECTIGDGISLTQKSKYEYKSGDSFMYFKLNADGELVFTRFEEKGNYGTYFTGRSIALDPNGDSHIIGFYTDTIQLEEFFLPGIFRTNQMFYSRWQEDKLLELENVGNNNRYALSPTRIGFGSTGQFAVTGVYNDKSCSINILGKEKKFGKYEYGNATFVYGGSVPVIIKSEPVLLATKTIRSIHLETLKPLLACLKPQEVSIPNIWFPTADSIPTRETWLSESPCGREIVQLEASLFPNPSVGLATLKLNGMMGGQVQLDVFSEYGALLFSQRITVPNNEYLQDMNLSSSAPGIYFVRIVHGGFEKAIRMVKI